MPRMGVLGVAVLLVATPAMAQGTAGFDRWSGSLGMGYGALTVESDQATSGRIGTFAMRFGIAYALGPRVAVGLSLGGYLIESFNANDPAAGESVSEFLVSGAFRPSRRLPFTLELGVGRASFTDRSPDGVDAGGWTWSAGVGYDLLRRRALRLTASAHTAGGGFDDTGFPAVRSNFRYSVQEGRLTAHWGWGGRR